MNAPVFPCSPPDAERPLDLCACGRPFYDHPGPAVTGLILADPGADGEPSDADVLARHADTGSCALCGSGAYCNCESWVEVSTAFRDLADRLRRADAALTVHADRAGNYDAPRLYGKREGVRLALAYVEEYLR